MDKITKMCPQCQQELEITNKFCSKCGQKQIETSKEDSNSKIIILLLAILILPLLIIVSAVSPDNSSSEIPIEETPQQKIEKIIQIPPKNSNEIYGILKNCGIVEFLILKQNKNKIALVQTVMS